MTNRINPKACPFCFGEPYLYKTRNGLLRHVMNFHMHDSRGKSVYPPMQKAKQVRKDTTSGFTYVPVDDWQEVEDFLLDYIKGFKNPSKRSSRLWQYVNGS